MVEISKQQTSWNTILEPITGNVVISEVDALMYGAIRKAEKHVPYAELLDTTECRT
jgi:hypothetical protein